MKETNGHVRKTIILFALFAIIVSIIYMIKPMYYINDDWIIRDILSGRYSGKPDGHIYDVIYPFACVFAWMYKLLPQIDWWGGYLSVSILICLFLIIKRMREINPHDALSIFLTVLLFAVVSLFPTFVFTFTTTGSMLVSTGLFLLITGNEKVKPNKEIAIVLLILAFCTRRDTFYMGIPWIIIWFLKRLIGERKKYVKKDIVYIFALTSMIGVLMFLHTVAFRSDIKWNDYLVFRSLRIQVHDYTGYPSYEDNQEFYNELGVSREELNIIKPGQVNTAFDIDPDIRTVLQTVGEYGHNKADKQYSIKRLILQTWEYIKRIYYYHKWMVLSVVALLLFGVTIVCNKKRWWQLILLAASFFTIIFELGYLAYRGRFTPAVGNSVAILAAWSMFAIISLPNMEDNKTIGNRKIDDNRRSTIAKISMLVILMIFAGMTIKKTCDGLEGRRASEKIRKQIDDYCVINSENHYFEPAFSISSASYSLSEMDRRFNNLIVLGGWNFSSPEYEEVMHSFDLAGSGEIENAIINKTGYYIISNETLMSPIIQYLKWKYGDNLQWRIIDRVADYANVYEFEIR